MRRQLSQKKSLLVICQTLQLFVNTLTVDDNYSHLKGNKLMNSIQIQLSKEERYVAQFFKKIFQM